MDTCCICGRNLPNRWAVARRETAPDGTERCYCAMHAHGGGGTEERTETPAAAEPAEHPTRSTDMMTKEEDGRKRIDASEERKLVQKADAKAARKAWDACADLAGRVGGGLKALWAKIHPDRSPKAMVESLNQTLDANRKRVDELKPVLEATYADIVAKKAIWQKATEARRRLLKPELETLLARYNGQSREFGVLNENIRSLEAVKARYLEVLAYEMRGVLAEDRVDELSDLVGDKAEEADGLQDALADLEKAGRRRERATGNLDDALAEFDGELGLADVPAPEVPAAETAATVPPRPAGAERVGGEVES